VYFVSQMSLRNWSSLLNFPNVLDSGLKSGGGSSKSEVLLLSGVSCVLPGAFLRTEGQESDMRCFKRLDTIGYPNRIPNVI
jgi:hypothetical protein